MVDIEHHDEPLYSVELTDNGDWEWIASYHRHPVSGCLWSPYIGRGITMTRWGARRAAKRSVRHFIRHLAKQSKDIPPTPLSGSEGRTA